MTYGPMTPRAIVARASLLLAVASLGLLAMASTAMASSIVFIKGHDVWLTSPDGSRMHRVTADGTAESPYASPSQADDGTIVAKKGKGRDAQLHRMRQNGEPLNRPFTTAARGTGPLDPTVSPDGRTVAFWFLSLYDPPCYPHYWCARGIAEGTMYTASDRFTDPGGIGGTHWPGGFRAPSWMGNGRIMLFSAATVWTDVLGPDDPTEWWGDNETHDDDIRALDDGEITRAGDKIALVRGDKKETIELYSSGPLPAKPTPRCVFSNPSGGSFVNPSWSPDGSQLAWEEGDGVVIVPTPSFADCGTPGSSKVFHGASDPDWGPADVNPSADPNLGSGRAGKCAKLKGKKRAACVRKRCGTLRGKKRKTCAKKVTRIA